MEIVRASAKLLNPYEGLISDEEYFTKQLKHIEKIARICYKSEENITEDSYKKFIGMLVKRKHLAMIEHGGFSILFTIDRGISHEIVRHRMASFAQESTRYCNYSKDKFGKEIKVIKPDDDLLDHVYIWEAGIKSCEKTYMELIDQGISPQIARGVLPTALKTELVMTANFREWLHFLELRLSREAHPQIRTVAREVLVLVEKYAPCLLNL